MNDDDDDEFPTIGEYRGVPLHAFQDAARLAVVRKDIDAICNMPDIESLIHAARDVRRAPEARLFAAAKVEAVWDGAVASREERPKGIDLEYVRALVSGLDSRHWADKDRYGCLLDVDCDEAVERDEPLPDDFHIRSRE